MSISLPPGIDKLTGLNSGELSGCHCNLRRETAQVQHHPFGQVISTVGTPCSSTRNAPLLHVANSGVKAGRSSDQRCNGTPFKKAHYHARVVDGTGKGRIDMMNEQHNQW